MDIYTKVFLINWVVIFCMAVLDTHVFNDNIENGEISSFIFGIWCICSFVSIPVWLICLIYTWEY